MKFPPEQEAINSRCFHPSGNFVEFGFQEIEQTVADRFERIARIYPESIAVKTKSGAVTYSQLDRVAERIAQQIAAQTGGQPRPIALLFEHGADIVAALLGVWKARGIYVPLDPALSPARNRTILAQSEASVIVTHAGCRAYASQIQGKLELIDIDAAEAMPACESSKLGSGKPDDLAYILFTSGSTGEPKGVVQNHRNLLNQIKKETNRLHFCADDRLLLLRSCSVIGGVRIVLSALMNGAAV
jgi:non-ribosomal peptide synthetase component F